MAGYKDVPGCTCCLFVGALTCHVMVLLGNLNTAAMLKNVGASAGGWSSIGAKVTYGLDNELNPAMTQVSTYLTDAIDAVTAIETGIDTVLSSAGASTDAALAKFDAKKHNDTQFKEKAMQSIEKLSKKMMVKVDELVKEFMEILKPALKQIGHWLESFSEKIQDILEEFGTTIDRAQKIFDQAMAQLSTEAGDGVESMISDTYSIFDADSSGSVAVQEVQDTAKMYSITALQGGKAEELFEKYDPDGSGDLDIKEYAKLVQDPSLPGLMTTILRQYAGKLAVIGGRFSLSTMRAELADAMVDYFGIVCTKNLTKVQWVTSYLVGGKISHEFVADLLYELVQNMNSPDALTTMDVGQLIVNYTMEYDPKFTIAALDLMCNTSFFESEGFDITIEDETAVQVVKWILNSKNGLKSLEKYAQVQPQNGESYIKAYNRVTQAREKKFASAQTSAAGFSGLDSYSSPASQNLQNILLGGSSAVAAGTDPSAAQVQGSGVPALQPTLNLAKELSDNISEAVAAYTEECFVYSGTSSNALDSVANSISGMVKKTQAFLSLMEKYAGPNGTDILTLEAEQFAEKTSKDIMTVTQSYMDSAFEAAKCAAGDKTSCETTRKAMKDMPIELEGGLTFLTSTLNGLKMALPTVIKNLGTAKAEVQVVSSAINSIMTVLGLKAPPMFDQISSLYKTVWVLYFVFFLLFTTTMLFYAFWANGFFGGPSPSADTEGSYEPPQTFVERMRTCCNSCLACLKGCSSGHLCFWSMLLLTQVVVLLLFIISLAICLITGVQAFVGASCSMIYLIGDDSVCTTTMSIIQTFLRTFKFNVPTDNLCYSKHLLTCGLIRDEVYSTAIYVMVGAILASVLSFQMLLDSAVKHERARCRRIMEKEKES